MERKKINFRKPVELVDPTARAHAKLALYNADGNRVVWVDDRVYPIDDYGCVTANIEYPTKKAYVKGDQIIRNIEPKDCIVLVKTSDKPTWNVFSSATSSFSDAEYIVEKIKKQNYYLGIKIIRV